VRLFSLACWSVVLLAGCTGQPAPLEDDKSPAGPGRFAHSYFHKTIAPWDGAAVQLFLAEKPMTKQAPVAPYVSVRIYRAGTELSMQRVRLEGKESRQGHARWIPRQGEEGPLSWVEVRFEEIKEGKPVKGTYEVAFPDGKRERGRFEAAWWPSDGPGG